MSLRQGFLFHARSLATFLLLSLLDLVGHSDLWHIDVLAGQRISISGNVLPAGRFLTHNGFDDRLFDLLLWDILSLPPLLWFVSWTRRRLLLAHIRLVILDGLGGLISLVLALRLRVLRLCWCISVLEDDDERYQSGGRLLQPC
jgi:hypothetical protein